MKVLCLFLFLFFSPYIFAQRFSCPAGDSDMMKYFVMSRELRAGHFMSGSPNPIYTEVIPNKDFDGEGRWLWLKSANAHGFDVKAFDERQIYMRSTEWVWDDNTTFKRFEADLPIAARCVPEGRPGPEIKVVNTTFRYFSACRPVKSSNIGTAVNDLDAPQMVNTGGSLGSVWTRVLHYHYNCDSNFQNCKDEEQFFLANGYGLWQWKHFRNGKLMKTALMNNVETGTAQAGLPCPDSYQK